VLSKYCTTLSDGLHHYQQFTLENEIDGKLNSLNVCIARVQDSQQLGMFRKAMARDMLIHSNSCHPVESKMSGMN
jgi:hypothetical protein